MARSTPLTPVTMRRLGHRTGERISRLAGNRMWRAMNPWYVLLGLLLPPVVAGCASQQEIQSLRADVQAMERQRSPRGTDMEQRVQALGDQLVRVEQSQMDARRELAQTVAATQE